MATPALLRGLMALSMVGMLVAGCGDDGDAGGPPETAADLVAAREAVLRHLRTELPDAPAEDLEWQVVARPPDQPPLPDWREIRFAGDGWTVTVGNAVLAPGAERYEVVVSNPSAGVDWEGRVSAAGWVAEGPETILRISDTVLAHLEEHHPDLGLSGDLPLAGGRATAEGLLGHETYEYTSGEWTLSIGYPVVAPELVVYDVTITNPNAGIQWQGTVDADGEVSEGS